MTLGRVRQACSGADRRAFLGHWVASCCVGNGLHSLEVHDCFESREANLSSVAAAAGGGTGVVGGGNGGVGGGEAGVIRSLS